MGSGASANPSEPAKGGTAVTTTRRKSLMKNEAMVMSFIKKNIGRATPKIPLGDILKDSKACHNLRRYINEAYMADLVNNQKMDERSASQAKEIASNYLQFYLDASDFLLFSASSFRNLRAEQICDRYFDHGALKQLPISRLMVDDIITARDLDTNNIPSDIFSAAQGEAFDFLEVEVLPNYLRNETQYGYRMVQKLNSVVTKLRHSKQKNTPLADMHSKLSMALLDPVATRAFKDFLTSVGQSELILFYLDVMDFKEMFTAVLRQEALNAMAPKATTQTRRQSIGSAIAAAVNRRAEHDHTLDRNFHYFLTRSNKIYDKYLKLGSPLRDLFTDQDLEQLVTRVSSVDVLNPSLFDDLKDKAFEVMLTEHFAEFQKSEQNQSFEKWLEAKKEKRKKSTEYLKSRQRKINVMKQVDVMRISPKRTSAPDGPHLSIDNSSSSTTPPIATVSIPTTTTKDDNTSSETATASNNDAEAPGRSSEKPSADLDDPEVVEHLLKEDKEELMDMLNNNMAARFQAFLNESQEANKIVFWFEVEDFKAIPLTQTTFVEGRAQKVFDKFIKRGSPLELLIEPDIRNRIIFCIDQATHTIFDDAQSAIFDVLLKEDYPSFKQTTDYLEYLKDKDTRRRQTGGNTAATPHASELLFVEILSIPTMCGYFKKFVETEFCIEPLMFWMEVEDFKRLPRSEYMKSRARKIINRYIKERAPMAISISEEAALQIFERMDNPGPLCFQQAELEVYAFMESCLLPKFRRSSDYAELLAYADAQRRAVSGQSSVKPQLDMDVPGDDCGDSSEGPVTLRNLLKSQTGVSYFKDFLSQRHCEENLLFWLEAEDFKNIPGTDYLKIRARKISSKFITESAKQQINIPHTLRDELLASIETPTRSTFQKAQDEVFKVIQRDSFPSFLNSDQFKTYQELMQGTPETNWKSILRRSSGISSLSSFESARATSYVSSQA